MKGKLFKDYVRAVAGDRVSIGCRICEWIIMQAVDEAEEVELEMTDVLFLGKFFKIWTKSVAILKPATRGFIMDFDVGHIEVFLRGGVYQLLIYPDKNRHSGTIARMSNVKFDPQELKKIEEHMGLEIDYKLGGIV